MLHRTDRSITLTTCDRTLIKSFAASLMGVGIAGGLLEVQKTFFPVHPTSYAECIKDRKFTTVDEVREWQAYCNAPQVEHPTQITIALEAISNISLWVGTSAFFVLLARVVARRS